MLYRGDRAGEKLCRNLPLGVTLPRNPWGLRLRLRLRPLLPEPPAAPLPLEPTERLDPLICAEPSRAAAR